MGQAGFGPRTSDSALRPLAWLAALLVVGCAARRPVVPDPKAELDALVDQEAALKNELRYSPWSRSDVADLLEVQLALAGSGSGDPRVGSAAVLYRFLLAAGEPVEEEWTSALRVLGAPPEPPPPGFVVVPRGSWPTTHNYRVTISRAMHVGADVLSWRDWEALVGTPYPYLHKRHCGEPDCPSEVGWFTAAFLANRASLKEGLSPCYELLGCSTEAGPPDGCVGAKYLWPERCDGYRLPSEFEWEHLARAAFARAIDTAGDMDIPAIRFSGVTRPHPWEITRLFGGEWTSSNERGKDPQGQEDWTDGSGRPLVRGYVPRGGEDPAVEYRLRKSFTDRNMVRLVRSLPAAVVVLPGAEGGASRGSGPELEARLLELAEQTAVHVRAGDLDRARSSVAACVHLDASSGRCEDASGTLACGKSIWLVREYRESDPRAARTALADLDSWAPPEHRWTRACRADGVAEFAAIADRVVREAERLEEKEVREWQAFDEVILSRGHDLTGAAPLTLALWHHRKGAGSNRRQWPAWRLSPDLCTLLEESVAAHGVERLDLAVLHYCEEGQVVTESDLESSHSEEFTREECLHILRTAECR